MISYKIKTRCTKLNKKLKLFGKTMFSMSEFLDDEQPQLVIVVFLSRISTFWSLSHHLLSELPALLVVFRLNSILILVLIKLHSYTDRLNSGTFGYKQWVLLQAFRNYLLLLLVSNNPVNKNTQPTIFCSLERLYTEDEVEWEGKMSASEAIATSLRVVTAPSTSQDASKSRRLAHLSALVKMWQKREAESDNDGLRLHEIMLW